MDLSRRDFLKEGAAFAAMGGRRGFLKCALAAGAFPHLAFAAPEGGANLLPSGLIGPVCLRFGTFAKPVESD